MHHMGRKFGRLCVMLYLPRVQSPMPTKMWSSSFGYTIVPITHCWKNLLLSSWYVREWTGDEKVDQGYPHEDAPKVCLSCYLFLPDFWYLQWISCLKEAFKATFWQCQQHFICLFIWQLSKCINAPLQDVKVWHGCKFCYRFETIHDRNEAHSKFYLLFLSHLQVTDIFITKM